MDGMPVEMWPIVIIQNRFGDHVGGASWIAISNGNQWYKIQSRATWMLLDEDGPCGEEREAVNFWRSPPKWVAVGETPDAAVIALKRKMLD
jgi:hypothetical protein